MQLFARITKVDEAAHTVEGVIADETPDSSGEIFDYAKSKPHFESWSTGIAKATDGKSLGNVRVMHTNTVAGVTKELNFDDTAKAIVVKAHIADDNEWNKTLAGCYTGFSIGGRYGSKWTDGAHKRYEAIPNEYSLVDLPCNPSAQFTVVKVDGSEELRKFETTTDDEALGKWVESLPDAIHSALLHKIAQRKDTNPKEGEHKYGDVKFADEKNKKYPIDTAEHIRAAWNYIHKGEDAGKYSAGDVAAIKAKIVAAWKDKIDPSGPPSAEKADTDGDLSKAAQNAGADEMSAELQKSLDDKTAELSKLQTEHTAELAKVQAEHDATKAELAKSQGELAAANESLTKANAEIETMKKDAAEVHAEVLKMKDRIEKPKGVARVVEKASDNNALGNEPALDDKPVMKADGTVDQAATTLKLMKFARSNPIV